MDCEFNIVRGSALAVLKGLDAEWIHCAVTSPPYYHQRDYKVDGQIGQEQTPEDFIRNLADIFDEVKRVLVPEGSLWVNIDDTYHKGQLLGIPWRLALELQRRGWFLRCDNIWFKSDTRPEPVKNRNCRSHEYLFHLTKIQSGYYFDMDAIREPHTNPWVLDCLRKFAAQPDARPRLNPFSKEERHRKQQSGLTRAEMGSRLNPKGRAKRSVWQEHKWFRLKPGLTPEQVTYVLKELAAYGHPHS